MSTAKQRRQAVRRAEAETNSFLDWLHDQGHYVHPYGATASDCYEECLSEEIERLEETDET